MRLWSKANTNATECAALTVYKDIHKSISSAILGMVLLSKINLTGVKLQ